MVHEDFSKLTDKTFPAVLKIKVEINVHPNYNFHQSLRNIKFGLPKFLCFFKSSLETLELNCLFYCRVTEIPFYISAELSNVETLKLHFTALSYIGDEKSCPDNRFMNVKNLTVTADSYQRLNERVVTAESQLTAFQKILKLALAFFPNVENLTVNKKIPDDILKFIYGNYRAMKDVHYVQ
jgi:hypothetical protein